MNPRLCLLTLPPLALLALGASTCPSGGPDGSLVVQELVNVPGFVEPNTPGSGVAGVEMPASETVERILGPNPDLNRVTYLRTSIAQGPDAAPPSTIVILVPGFLGGAGTFAPLARQLVAKFNGGLEVWAIDRRPNQLEDRRGTDWALAQLALAETEADRLLAIEQGLFFYIPESEGFDINENGVIDPPFELPDALGDPNPFLRLAQDDVRFTAHWGVDTYLRDWKILVDEARSIVGPQGLVLFGGHSQGTFWASLFAAYDFDPDPGVVDAAYRAIDGLVLLEGGGGRGPLDSAPSLEDYLETVADLEQPEGSEVFLASFQGIEPATLGPAAEIAGLAGAETPTAPAIVQRTPLFSGFPFIVLFSAPADSRALVGLFIDDDFQPITAFRASVGFSADGQNSFVDANPPLIPAPIYIAEANDGLRRWMDFDDSDLPTCPPNVFDVSPGCAIQDLGPKPEPGEPPRNWGVEAEVTNLDDILEIQFAPSNFVEWYFLSGRPNLDFQFGVDSSALVAEAVAELGHEGPLVLTQNANIDIPVIGIGGSNGLTPTEASFANYFASIATPPEDQEVVILEGYAHLDVLTATDNKAVPALADWMNRLTVRKLLGGSGG